MQTDTQRRWFIFVYYTYLEFYYSILNHFIRYLFDFPIEEVDKMKFLAVINSLLDKLRFFCKLFVW